MKKTHNTYRGYPVGREIKSNSLVKGSWQAASLKAGGRRFFESLPPAERPIRSSEQADQPSIGQHVGEAAIAAAELSNIQNAPLAEPSQEAPLVG